MSSGRGSGVVGDEAAGDTSDELDMVLPAMGGRLAVTEERYEAGLNDRPKVAIRITLIAIITSEVRFVVQTSNCSVPSSKVPSADLI